MSMSNSYKTSLLIPSQLPEYIRDDPSYSKFVAFLQAYYEWLDNQSGALYESKKLLTYNDIDTTTSQFIDYFYNDFLQNFPKDILADKTKVAKIAKELYRSKGTPESFKFLFRILYNSDVDFFNTRDAVLRASAGTWYVSKSLRLSSSDVNFLKTTNLRVFGETTKSLAIIQNTSFTGNKIEIFISDIQRQFKSGEFIRVVDSNNQDVLFNGNILRSKIVGQVSKISIDPDYRGLTYQPNDPVIIYGGLSSPTDHGATALVGSTTKGSITRINVLDGGYGYSFYPNTIINITNAPGATANVASVNPLGIANVSLIPLDYIGKKANIKLQDQYHFSANDSANLYCTLANAFTFTSFTTYPISSLKVENGGIGISQTPTITAQSIYRTEDNFSQVDLKTLGILAPIQILSGGVGYVANDVINITGGSGYGAFANVMSVSVTGAITSIKYVHNEDFYWPLGGMGYNLTGLPSLSVISANTNAYGASLTVPGILGDGAVFNSTFDRVGSISSINITDSGEDYISNPNVSLKVQDIVVSGLNPDNLPVKGDIVYQENSPYMSFFDSLFVLSTSFIPEQTLYNLRVYNYSTKPIQGISLKVETKDIVMNISNLYTGTNPSNGRTYDEYGIISYGDGSAKATSEFLNGINQSQGQYLDASGHPSSFDVLQSEIYNNYTYQLTLEKEISKYREILLGLLHPTGMKVIGRNVLRSNNTFNMEISESLQSGRTLGYYTSNPGSSLTLQTTFDNPSNNIIKFNALPDANIENFIFPGSTIRFTTLNGDEYSSIVTSVTDGDANTITISDNVFLTFANVAYITANAGSNVINISSITNSYNIINNGNYSDPNYPLKDIVRVGDSILIANNTQKTVSDVDYVNNMISVDSNFANNSNSLLSVNRTWTANGNYIQIFGPVGIQYIPEITDELGNSITTEDNRIIILG